MEGIPQLVWRAKESGDWIWASPQWLEYTGQAQADSLGKGWLAAVHPEDRETVAQGWAEAGNDMPLEIECRIRRARDGTYRWFTMRAKPVQDDAGHIIEWLGTCTDINDLRDLQARQHVLVAELQHRTRNLLGVVRAISEQTARTSTDLAHFRERFSDRLAALARVQGLLSRLHDYDRVTFDELLHAELTAMNGDPERIVVSGPTGVRLRSSTVQMLALALHELATNAVKYGALRQAGARLSIIWKVEPNPADESQWLNIEWRETGVVLDPDPSRPAGSGQGRELIERALPHQLGARTSYTLEATGVRCTIAVPISQTV